LASLALEFLITSLGLALFHLVLLRVLGGIRTAACEQTEQRKREQFFHWCLLIGRWAHGGFENESTAYVAGRATISRPSRHPVSQKPTIRRVGWSERGLAGTGDSTVKLCF
jgi:hypothetical protein